VESRFGALCGQIAFSKPVSQPNQGSSQWSAPKRTLLTSPNRPQPVGGECRSIADVHLDGCSEAVIDLQLANQGGASPSLARNALFSHIIL